MDKELQEANDHPGDSPRTSPRMHRDRGRNERPRIPSVEEILQQLVQLNGAVTLGIISTKEAAIIQKNLKTVLDAQLKRANRQETGPSQEALADLCRKDPRILNTIESFLSDSQIDWLMDQIKDDADGSA